MDSYEKDLQRYAKLAFEAHQQSWKYPMSWESLAGTTQGDWRNAAFAVIQEVLRVQRDESRKRESEFRLREKELADREIESHLNKQSEGGQQ